MQSFHVAKLNHFWPKQQELGQPISPKKRINSNRTHVTKPFNRLPQSPEQPLFQQDDPAHYHNGVRDFLVVGSVGEGLLYGRQDRQILPPGFLCMVVHQRYESTKFTGTNIRHKVVAAVERIILFYFQIQTNQSFLNPLAFLMGSILFRNKLSIRN